MPFTIIISQYSITLLDSESGDHFYSVLPEHSLVLPIEPLSGNAY